MPIAPAQLLHTLGLKMDGTVPWGKTPKPKKPGVYAVSLCEDSACISGLLAAAPIDLGTVNFWLNRVPTLTLRGSKPDATQLADFLQGFWLADESIVYIGKATSLYDRLGQFRRHVLGDSRPHAGGHWMKTLSNLNDVFIHYCICDTVEIAKDKEDDALAAFKAQVSAPYRALHNPIPFANQEHPQGTCKQREIRGHLLG